VTILFPFLPSENLVPDVRRRLAAVATSVDPFEALFNRTGHFPGVIYLAPEPAAPFVRLTELVLSQFPDHPPYGGAFDEIVPHLTICDSEAAPLDALAEQAARSLPFGRPVAAIEVLIEGADDLWHPRWRLPLGKASRTDHKVRQ
jgi:hypothetical protein